MSTVDHLRRELADQKQSFEGMYVLSSENGFVENSCRTKLERSFDVVGLNKAVR
jgi:hypothetical protein